MSKNHPSVSAAQLERRQASQAKRQRRDRFWTIVMVVFLVGMVALLIAIQISHHV